MKRFARLLLVSVLLISLSVVSVFTVSMVGDNPSKVQAGYIEDIHDICLITNTYLTPTTDIVDWDGFFECLDLAL